MKRPDSVTPAPPDDHAPTRWWRRTTVIGKEVAVTAAEVEGKPGACAGCRRFFREHTDAELQACAATFEETQPEEEEAP